MLNYLLLMFSKLTGVCHGCFEIILREMELIMHLNMNNFFFFFGYMYVRRCENINNNIGLWVVGCSVNSTCFVIK